nr:hypothetical protein pPsy0479a_00051 [Pseudomonas syringae]
MDTQSIDTNKVAHCTFELTGQPMSLLKCSNNENYDAFSGLTGYSNNPSEVSNAKARSAPARPLLYSEQGKWRNAGLAKRPDH